MIQDAWIDEILQAVRDMVDEAEIKRIITAKLDEAYNDGYDDARQAFET